MGFKEPEITQIAHVLADKIPTLGVEQDDAVQAWRKALRCARKNGAIDELAVRIAATDIEDDELQSVCADVAHV